MKKTRWQNLRKATRKYYRPVAEIEGFEVAVIPWPEYSDTLEPWFSIEVWNEARSFRLFFNRYRFARDGSLKRMERNCPGLADRVEKILRHDIL
jgi:hypothetical protein